MTKHAKDEPAAECSGDFASTAAEGGCVVVEANEWDPSIAIHRSVTLYLQPREARVLAGKLLRVAEEAGPRSRHLH